ncbi:putative membrane protein [Halobacteroides halobius DSM 5150]|uniref:Putative membrane protein n=1 Tax=Halobacteroides halobius (strain ATCC 35273 / DSM 5150 / MD-1) TaxID=748449 RepID=L0K940_HALHC|nr:DUF1614 domain-containing protein [Halobacteroides halobius]AGB41536.1 putative membrane protein [Halobacteroides halobius DSM 5150]
MPMGVIILVGLELFIYLFISEKAIKQIGLNKKELLFGLTAMLIGSFINFPISNTPEVEINVGGAVVPIILAVFILSKIKTAKLFKSFVAILITGLTIFFLTKLYQFEEGYTVIDSNYLFPIVAAIVAYLTGRSRKVAFVAGGLGFLVYDVLVLLQVINAGVPTNITIGGAGILDSIVISGSLAILLVELIGETKEDLDLFNE